MKSIFRKIVLWALKLMAKFRMRKFRGKVIGVTGSVGKTTTKDAIYTVLNSRFRVKRSKESMNSEFGLLLTILDIESGYSSVRKWSWYLVKAFFHCLFRDHSEILLLEMGVDKPKDMNFLLSVVRPDISVMTQISPVHLGEGQFEDLEGIFKEKRKIVDKMKKDGKAVLNVDNVFLKNFAKELGKKKAVTYGVKEKADYSADRVKTSIDGLDFVVKNGDSEFQGHVDILGNYQVYALLPALICGKLMGMSMEEALSSLAKFELPPGRMSVIDGVDGVKILDSSYNSSPRALHNALKTLDLVAEKENRRVAVLGNMNDLGEQSQVLHELVGKEAGKYVDFLITLGAEAKHIGEKALEEGMNVGAVHNFGKMGDAVDFYRKEMKKGDIVLVKGSQNQVRLERFVKEFMAVPEDAKEKLVRQTRVWKAKL